MSTPFFKKPEFTITSVLALIAIMVAVCFGYKGVTKKDLTQTVGVEFQKRIEELGLLAPKTYQEIKKAIGKSCPEVGETVCNMIKSATEDLQNGKYAEAEQSYKVLTELFPDIAELHFNLASCYYYQGKMEEGLKELQDAIRIKPNAWSIRNNLGVILHGLNRYNEAEKEYGEAIRINPNYADAHSNLGVLLRVLNRYAEAEKEFREAIRINPNYADAHANLGLLCKSTNKKSEAKKELLIARNLFEKQTRAEAVKEIDEMLNDLK